MKRIRGFLKGMGKEFYIDSQVMFYAALVGFGLVVGGMSAIGFFRLLP